MELDHDILQEFSREFSDNSVEESEVADINHPQQVHFMYLEKYFGHTSFRPLQWDIINAIMNRKKDVCAVMATGYGKSLCYQYPAVFTGGVALVISPLISLMEDQVQALTISNIPACLMGSAGKSSYSVLDNDYRVIFMTPEFVSGDRGKEFLIDIKDRNVVVIAVDEAHCISSWGHDFRFAYCELKVLRDIFPDVPLLAVTATATLRVRNDITTSLKMRDPLLFCSSFDRPNLYFEVNHRSGNSLVTNLRRVYNENWRLLFNESTIVYTITRSRADEIAKELNGNNIHSLAYHAGKTLKQRTEVHQRFIHDELKVIVATIAFGMGINKPDVRNVIHFGASRDMDSYYQEVGRAGRDGSPAKCITFYSLGDFGVHEHLRQNASNEMKHKKECMSELMKKYLLLSSCRRAFILSYFEGKSPDSLEVRPDCCDVCKSKSLINVSNCTKFGLNAEGKYKVQDDYVRFLTVVKNSKTNYGLKKYITQLNKQRQLLRTHPTYHLKTDDFVRWWEEIGKLLIRDGYITNPKWKATGFKYSFIVYTVSSKGITFLENAQKGFVGDVWETPSTDIYRLLKCSKPAQTERDHSVSVTPAVVKETNKEKTVTIEDSGTKDLYKALLKKRLELAESCDCMPYMVASNEALMKMSISKPKDIPELSNLKLDGFTEGKIQRFGMKFLETIAKFTPQKKSLCSILLKNPLKNDTWQTLGSELTSFIEKNLSISEIADAKNTTENAVWESIAIALREGFEFKLTQFGITPHMKEDVARIILEDNIFLTRIPDFNAAEHFKKNTELQIEVGKILLIWTYLQIRMHLYNLNVEFDDFDPMANLRDFLPREKTVEENNLDMLLNEIENGTKNEMSDDGSSTDSNITNEETIAERKSPVLGSSKECHKEQQNDQSSVFDDEFNAIIERMETPPLAKKQKLDLPVKTEENETNIANVKNTQAILEDKIPKRSFSLLKKNTKQLPPWLKNGT